MDPRTILIEDLHRDLVGPAEEEEIINERPSDRYLTGILFPRKTPLDPSEDDSQAESGEDGDSSYAGQTISPALSMRPSSIGLTCQVDRQQKIIMVHISYGIYEEVQFNDFKSWQRIPKIIKGIKLDLSNGGGRKPLEEDVSLEWVVRERPDTYIITVFLVNRKKFTDMYKDTDCIFQPVINLKARKKGKYPFISRKKNTSVDTSDPDLASYSMLYRHRHELGVGHGCSPVWKDVKSDRCAEISSTYFPVHEIISTEHLESGQDGYLDMKKLATAKNGEAIYSLLKPVSEGYLEWIQRTRKEITRIDAEFREMATKHMERCKEAASRINRGLELIKNDRNVFEAFAFANRSMLYQRSHSIWAGEYRKTGKRIRTRPHYEGKWRIFQIAFILMNIEGIALPSSKDRKVADLLWFPTGGGKTEAYLGLAAFTMAMRRLRFMDISGAGVTVLMRYTLRLLTIQQYQRAATLICACEYIRRQDKVKWGDEPFLIGLWVGSSTTPNSFEDARDIISSLKNNNAVTGESPVQLHNCPWCGEKLTAYHYYADNDRNWILIHCPRNECDFHGAKNDPMTAIPALTTDSDIYTRLPSLLIGTVDKFARLPWNYRTAAIFGVVDKHCPRHGYFTPGAGHEGSHRAKRQSGLPEVTTRNIKNLPPPELIIQDELHLIAGPLGTMTGLYETAVDYLCTDQKGICPKVIASTATIRRAVDQVKNVFCRNVFQFPPPGITCSDSYFSFENENKPGRMYAGICASGRSAKTTMVRVYARLLQSVWERIGKSPEYDPYLTLAGYFNSLRELGGALRLVEDDIPDRMLLLAGGHEGKKRPIERIEELTSRMGSGNIPEVLKKLELDVLSGKFTDVLLSTNMISVGVDVERLGLMVVNGQPKSTSEYIQATSRVGRKFPGIVITLYNPFRPRDISHYERFVAYHSMLYRHVEATSVTPFSPRARDKGLRAIIIGMARILESSLAENKDATKFDRTLPVMNRIVRAVLDRIRQIEPAEERELEREIQAVFDWWDNMVASCTNLQYSKTPYPRPGEEPLLCRAGEENGEAWPTPDSMREVEPESDLYYSR